MISEKMKETNESILKKKIKELRGHPDVYKSLSSRMVQADGGALFPMDMLSIAVIHRAMCLISGFCELIEKENFICAAPLVRLMLDNLLRFYAAWLVDKPHEFALKILDGKEVRQIKGRNGNKLTDNYLAKQLSKEYKWILDTYRGTSGYIHLSSKHYFNTIKNFNANDGTLTFTISDRDTCVQEEFYTEAVNAMQEISIAVMQYLHSWSRTKEIFAISTKYKKK